MISVAPTRGCPAQKPSWLGSMSTFEEEASNGPKKEKGMFASIISRNKSEDEEGGEETGENGSGQPAYVPLNQQELTSAVQIQFNGSGDFATATATALGGVLTFTNVVSATRPSPRHPPEHALAQKPAAARSVLLLVLLHR